MKRVARIRREEGIKVSKKQRRMKRLAVSTAERQRAERPGQVWSWDFVVDQTENGSSFRILTLLDEHTRQCLAIHPAWSIRAVDVVKGANLFVALIPFFAFKEISRVIGPGELWSLLLNRGTRVYTLQSRPQQ